MHAHEKRSSTPQRTHAVTRSLTPSTHARSGSFEPGLMAKAGPAIRLGTLPQAAGAGQSIQRELLDDEEEEPLQLKALPQADADDSTIRQAAQAGVQTPAGRLPHYEQIQGAFGRHDLSHVRAHLGQEASNSARAMNAAAYATGHDVVFHGAPSLHTVAHEAAHVVQQQAGVQLAGGIGRVGDTYEQHADAVADRVVSGESAETLLDRMAPTKDEA